MLERAVVFCAGDVVTQEHIALSVPELGRRWCRSRLVFVHSSEVTGPPSHMTDERIEERQRIEEALDRCGGNQSRAAKLLGISRATLVNRLNVYGFPRPRKHVG